MQEEAYEKFSLDRKANYLTAYRKKTQVLLSFQHTPFTVETQEGDIFISPDTVDDWEDGYYIAYPEDGSKPYAIAPSFVRNNYEPVGMTSRDNA